MPACSPAAQGDQGFFWSLESSWAFAREADGSGGDNDDGEITDRIASLLEKSEYACLPLQGGPPSQGLVDGCARRLPCGWRPPRNTCDG
jgi:hypothetical protein